MTSSSPKAPAKPKRNHARISSQWLPISSLPSGGTCVMLADETQTITWFSEEPSRDAVRHSAYEYTEGGAIKFDDKGEPCFVDSVVTPAFWSPAVYVNDHGEPI